MVVGINLAARISLAFLWFFTGIVSIFFARDIGYQVLANAGITGDLAAFSLYSGGLLDVSIGIWLVIGKRLKDCYLIQMVVVAIYTVLLTVIEPDFWIHPFGPVTKNIPLLVMIYYLYRKEAQNST